MDTIIKERYDCSCVKYCNRLSKTTVISTSHWMFKCIWSSVVPSCWSPIEIHRGKRETFIYILWCWNRTKNLCQLSRYKCRNICDLFRCIYSSSSLQDRIAHAVHVYPIIYHKVSFVSCKNFFCNFMKIWIAHQLCNLHRRFRQLHNSTLLWINVTVAIIQKLSKYSSIHVCKLQLGKETRSNFPEFTWKILNAWILKIPG